MDLLRTREIYVNVCMNSFIIDVEALWSTVGLNKNEYPKHKSNVEGLSYLHLRDNWCFIHDIQSALWQENSLRTMQTAPCGWTEHRCTLPERRISLADMLEKEIILCYEKCHAVKESIINSI